MNQAILTGINQYQNFPPGSEDDATLRGCVPDANHLWMLLADKMSWRDNDIFVLKDQMATAANEKADVLGMIKAAGPGSRLVWSHSSHGSNNPDPSQKDGMEELLCSYDLAEVKGRWDEDTCLTARWIGEAILKLHPKATLDIILDCCNAPEGGQLKALGRRYYASRFLPRQMGGKVDPWTGLIKAGMVPPNVALWSACEPNQTSADTFEDNSWQGAFTWAFLKSWAPQRSRSDIIYLARKTLAKARYQQVCHLYCGKELAQKPFGE